MMDSSASLTQLGQLLASKGSGKDTMLVHMNQNEFKALENKLGFKAGKNPMTGLPAFDPDLGGDDAGDDSADDDGDDSATADKSKENDPEGKAGSAGYGNAASPGDQAQQLAEKDAKDDSDPKKTEKISKDVVAQAVAGQTQAANDISAQVQNLKKDADPSKPIQSFANALGFLGDNLINKETGDSIRNAGAFISGLPAQLTSAFAAHAKEAANAATQSILTQAIPKLTSMFTAPVAVPQANPPTMYGTLGAQDQLRKQQGIFALTPDNQ